MAGIQVAETSKGKRAPKTLSHLELHPKLGGGHIVKHIYSGFGHEPKEVHFNENGRGKGGEHVVQHLTKHGGLPTYDRSQASETEEEFEA